MRDDKYNNQDIEKLQDAVGMVDDELVAEAREYSPAQDEVTAQPQGSSWTQMAMNTERHKKIKAEKKFENKALRAIAIVAACAVVASFYIIPRAFPGFMPLGEKTDMSVETEYSEDAASESAAPSDGASESAAPSDGVSESATAGESADVSSDASAEIVEDYDPSQVQIPNAEAFLLTAAEWNDNDNWPFFTNLINSGLISFPSYGLNPANRIKVTVTENGLPVQGQTVELLASRPSDCWTAVTNKDGVCYLFYDDAAQLISVASAGQEIPIEVVDSDTSGQGNNNGGYVIKDIEMEIVSDDSYIDGTQVMFIVDTTGSMSDELAYLQKDFAAIAEDTFDENMEFSVNFYRDEGDEYVTKVNGFTKNLATVQNQLNSETANGGGDTPEAVSDILMETIVENQEWDSFKNKVAFLIFDAPPHDGTEQQITAAVATAAERGIHLVPVVASNAERNTELFGRALAIMTDGTYVFLTDDSGIGNPHLEPIVGDYEVELLHDVIVRIINSYK